MHDGPAGGPVLSNTTAIPSAPPAAAGAATAAATASEQEITGNHLKDQQPEGAHADASSSSRAGEQDTPAAAGGQGSTGEASPLPKPGAIVEYPLTPREQDEYQDGRIAGKLRLQ